MEQKEGINVVSCFDGMGCLYIALKELGVKVNKYYAIETDKFCVKQTKLNFPDIIHLGDITRVNKDSFCGDKIHLFVGGSPCQGFSFAGKQLNFNDERSKLFFEFIRLKDLLNPRYFILENVNMKKEYLRVISEYMGLFPVNINSSLVSAQNRNRWYWSNIRTQETGLFSELWTDIPQPEDKGILLKDVLQDESEVDQKYYLNKFDVDRGMKTHRGKVWKSGNKMGNMEFPNDINKKSKCIVSTQISGARETNHISGLDINKKAPTQRISTGRCLDDKHNYQIIKVGVTNNNGKLKETKKSNCIDSNYHKGIDNHSQRTVICVSMEGRRLDEKGIRKDNDKTIIAKQQLEPNKENKTNCLTGVSKDNLIMIGGIKDFEFKEGNYSDFSQGARVYDTNGKSVCLSSSGGGLGAKTGLYKTPVYDIDKGNMTPQFTLRRLTPTECAKLQTIPEWYKWDISDTQQYKMLGNGFTVKVIEHILKFML